MKIVIVYHSAGGNTKSLAEVINKYLPQSQLFRVNEFDLCSLREYDCLLVGTYTWGNGDLPAKMSKFYEELEVLDLHHLSTGVFGTGETNYKHYCEGVNIFRNMLHVKSNLLATLKVEQAYQDTDLDRIKKYCSIIENKIIKIKGDTNMTKLIGLDYAKNQVKEFQAAFNHPVSEKPTSMKLDRGVSRAIWTGEEALVEFVHQSSSNEEEFLNSYDKLIAGLEKAKQKSLGLEYPKNEIEKIIGQSDALTDAAYFVLGSFVEMGVDPQPLLDIVQQANMAKLGADGNPIIRETDGKIMKPEGWEPPEAKLEVEIKRQVGK